MKKFILKHIAASVFLALPATVSLLALPTAASAQPASPEVDSLNVTADAGLAPGSRLSFKVEGTPRARAVVRLRGVKEPIALKEVGRGLYVGTYTIKRADRFDRGTEVRAVLRHGNRSSVANFALGDTMGPPPVAVVPPPPVPDLRIARFGITPLERIEPGAEIRFAVEGPAGANVSVDLPGVENDVRLREVRPGNYEGGYTIRRSDNLNPTRPIVATLRLGDRSASTSMTLPLPRQANDNRPPSLTALLPRDGETVPGAPSVRISAAFDDAAGSGIDPASVRVVVSGRNVTSEAQINRQGLSFVGVLPPGRHTVDVTATDLSGNVMRKGWSFEVAAAAPTSIPLQILNHSNNGRIPAGTTQVQGRTAPNASVAVTVQAVAPVGGILNLSQDLFSQTVQADANGNFAFSFSPRLPIPGTRYDISMVASRGNLTHDLKLTLFQREQ